MLYTELSFSINKRDVFKGFCLLTITVHYLSHTNFDTKSAQSEKKNAALDSDTLASKAVSALP